MKKNFYFFRHGQRNGIDEQSTLNKIGIAQAIKLAEFLNDKNVEIIYSSPLKRAQDTAKIAVNNPDIEIIPDDRLIETAFGFWYSDTDEKQQQITKNFNRIKSCLDDILANDDHTNIAVASHGGVTRALCFACGEKIGEIKHCECFHFAFDNGYWKFIERFDTKIEGVNEYLEARKISQIHD